MLQNFLNDIQACIGDLERNKLCPPSQKVALGELFTLLKSNISRDRLLGEAKGPIEEFIKSQIKKIQDDGRYLDSTKKIRIFFESPIVSLFSKYQKINYKTEYEAAFDRLRRLPIDVMVENLVSNYPAAPSRDPAAAQSLVFFRAQNTAAPAAAADAAFPASQQRVTPSAPPFRGWERFQQVQPSAPPLSQMPVPSVAASADARVFAAPKASASAAQEQKSFLAQLTKEERESLESQPRYARYICPITLCFPEELVVIDQDSAFIVFDHEALKQLPGYSEGHFTHPTTREVIKVSRVISNPLATKILEDLCEDVIKARTPTSTSTC